MLCQFPCGALLIASAHRSKALSVDTGPSNYTGPLTIYAYFNENTDDYLLFRVG